MEFDPYDETSNSICDSCQHCDKKPDAKPCCFCMQWVDGYLEATKFEPIKHKREE